VVCVAIPDKVLKIGKIIISRGTDHKEQNQGRVGPYRQPLPTLLPGVPVFYYIPLLSGL